MAPVASALLPNTASTGLHGFSALDLDAQATEPSRPNGKLVNWYNAQFYNGWGDASSSGMYEDIVSGGQWAADRVVMGVLTNPGDGGSGFVGLEVLKGVLGSLKGKYAAFGCAVGWEYWAAGTGDGLAAPWMWVKAVGEVVLGGAESAVEQPPSNGTVADGSSGTRKDPPTPWPSQMGRLEEVGAGHWDSVRALNMTNGQLRPAGDMLGVTDLLNEILGEALDIVGEVV